MLKASWTEDRQAGDIASVCAKCRPCLMCYVPSFKRLIHQGSDLKKRMHRDPNQERSCRNLKNQNEWLRENMFDAMGNYLFCCRCIHAVFGVSKQRIANQRKIKQQQSCEPLRQMSKTEVEEQRFGDFVVI